jgi:hypothetical protein
LRIRNLLHVIVIRVCRFAKSSQADVLQHGLRQVEELKDVAALAHFQMTSAEE